MARVFITGVAGFVGSSIAWEFLVHGHKIKEIDDLSTGNLDNIAELLSDREFVEGDHCDRDLVQRLCGGVDVVFQQGAPPSVPQFVIDPTGSHIANVNSDASVLVGVRDAGVRSVVFAASSLVHGESAVLPKSKTAVAVPMSSCVAKKLSGELDMQSFSQIYGIETV